MIKMALLTRSIEETLQEELNETVQEELNETVQEELNETAQEELNETVQEELNETVQEESEETLQEELNETVQEESEETLQEESNLNNIVCSICCDIILPVQNIHKPCPTSDLHVFHKECFNKYRTNMHYDQRCPNCRTDIKLKKMKPKGTCSRLKETCTLLENEKIKFNRLNKENKLIENTIKKIVCDLNINISHISKEKIIIKNNNSNSNLEQLDWRIKHIKNKQILEKQNHKKYLQELFKVIEENNSDYYDIQFLITHKNRINNM